MRKVIFFIFLLNISFLLTLQAQTRDNQFWLSAKIRKDLSKLFRVYYEQGYRTYDYLAGTKLLYSEAGVIIIPAKYFRFAGRYRFGTNLDDRYRHRIFGDVYLRLPVKRFTIRSRTRAQRESEKNRDPDFFLREELKLDYNIRKFPVDPFIASEFYSHLEESSFEREQLRFDLGVDWSISKRHSLELFYRFKHVTNVKNPVDANIFGTYYTFKW